MKEKLVCVVCGNEFAFEIEEQSIYTESGFENEPKRCRACRGSLKALSSAVKPEKEMHKAICAQCGKETQLPFKPKGDKPVFCQTCFASKKKM